MRPAAAPHTLERPRPLWKGARCPSAYADARPRTARTRARARRRCKRAVQAPPRASSLGVTLEPGPENGGGGIARCVRNDPPWYAPSGSSARKWAAYFGAVAHDVPMHDRIVRAAEHHLLRLELLPPGASSGAHGAPCRARLRRGGGARRTADTSRRSAFRER
jgi:hypothetical protein